MPIFLEGEVYCFWLFLFIDLRERQTDRERRKQELWERDRFVVPCIYSFIGWFLKVPPPMIEPATCVSGQHSNQLSYSTRAGFSFQMVIHKMANSKFWLGSTTFWAIPPHCFAFTPNSALFFFLYSFLYLSGSSYLVTQILVERVIVSWIHYALYINSPLPSGAFGTMAGTGRRIQTGCPESPYARAVHTRHQLMGLLCRVTYKWICLACSGQMLDQSFGVRCKRNQGIQIVSNHCTWIHTMSSSKTFPFLFPLHRASA